ncbi:hypothetical protein K440DRAFT_663336 [Wilcoxina mikolae CBS 423.85]|nr:hypothetical protein K440DRAFT_663336 [Wilcoxina mikolae CBS 423.85]
MSQQHQQQQQQSMSSSQDLRRLRRGTLERRAANLRETVVTMTVGFTTVTHSDTTMTHLLETTMTHVIDDATMPTSTTERISTTQSSTPMVPDVVTVTASLKEKPQSTTPPSVSAPSNGFVLGTAGTIGLACGIMIALAVLIGVVWWSLYQRKKARRGRQQAIELQAQNPSQGQQNTVRGGQGPQQIAMGAGYDSMASGQTNPQYPSHHSEGSSSHPDPWAQYNPAMSPPPHNTRSSPPIQNPRYPSPPQFRYPQESRYPTPPMDYRRYPSPPQQPPPRPETPRFPPPPENLPLAPAPLRIPQKSIPAHPAPQKEYSTYRQRGEAPSEIAMRRAAMSPIPDPYADSTVYSADDTSIAGVGGSSFAAGESTYTDMRVDEYRRIQGLPPWTESEMEIGMGRVTPEYVSELGPVPRMTESEFGEFDGGASAVTSGSNPVAGSEGLTERRSWEDQLDGLSTDLEEDADSEERLRRRADAMGDILRLERRT